MTPEQIQQEAGRLVSPLTANVKYADRLDGIVAILTERERLRQELEEAKFSAEHRKHLLDGAIYHREKAEADRDTLLAQHKLLAEVAKAANSNPCRHNASFSGDDCATCNAIYNLHTAYPEILK
jgi:hypothetical protein